MTQERARRNNPPQSDTDRCDNTAEQTRVEEPVADATKQSVNKLRDMRGTSEGLEKFGAKT
jgi:hypothetical protein